MREGRKLIYQNQESGGRVFTDEGRRTSASERFAARVLADSGHTVHLLKEREAAGVKSYDAEVDGAPWEFKELRTPRSQDPHNAVYQGLRRGKRQNNGKPISLLYHIHEDQERNLKRINEAVSDAVRRDAEGLIERVGLVFDSRQLNIFTADEIDHGQKF